MGRKCFVPNCRSGYSSCTEKVSLFSPPLDCELIEIWRRIIPRYDRKLTRKDRLCAKHFESKYIIKEWSDGLNWIPLHIYRLTKDAIPTIFRRFSNRIRSRTRALKARESKRNKVNSSVAGSSAVNACLTNVTSTSSTHCESIALKEENLTIMDTTENNLLESNNNTENEVQIKVEIDENEIPDDFPVTTHVDNLLSEYDDDIDHDLEADVCKIESKVETDEKETQVFPITTHVNNNYLNKLDNETEIDSQSVESQIQIKVEPDENEISAFPVTTQPAQHESDDKIDQDIEIEFKIEIVEEKLEICDEKPYKCNECDKSFKQLNNLKKHEKLQTCKKSYKCKQCEKFFTRTSNLRKHEMIHTGERPFSCKQCGKSFVQSCQLVAHQRLHNGEKPFHCKYCNKYFRTSSNLKTHERHHTGEKPYTCEECGKCFSCSQNLNQHERLHTGEKPYKCQQCKKSFTQNTHLKIHERIHTCKCNDIREKLIDVSRQCGIIFKDSSTLKSHERRHSGKTPYSCEQCGKPFKSKQT